MAEFTWDQKLIDKYNLSGPRYTSYPTALEFSDKYTNVDFEQALQKYPERPLSIYIHIPFCHTLCYFCACNKVITRHKEKADIYLDYLEKEMAYRAKSLQGRKVNQFHLGGGTPTYLVPAQMRRLMEMAHKYFNFTDDVEMGIEIDPRRIELNYMDMLVDLGFNRISIGIQDFDLQVQEAVNRVQDKEFIAALIAHSRELGINSINLDLIYGLPFQTVDKFANTLEDVIKLNPDRLSVFNYAHLPARVPGQAKIKEDTLPSARTKLDIFAHSIKRLHQADFAFIGMDHFAKPDNELALAQKAGVLHRNFQGYTTHGEADLVGLGLSSISMVGDTYAQNAKTTLEYYDLVEKNSQAIVKGFALSDEDCLRRDVIKQIICNFGIDYRDFEKLYNIDFKEHFKDEIQLLDTFIADGIVVPHADGNGFSIPESGKLFVRHVCMAFDEYSNLKRASFSRIL
ncbi:oxygen-independent coproporphyrinogen III oxidase [Psittacicella melopsittaci]|uniref:Coproporphyrinogen-III oxidase n=1 Tax=Psittacicella melopsittaci TaxID=2028576 RepID=A0A3A1YCD3_9GAMM|nr:oxygen-independent coproporphyrinogen III oxidase [Psittacicella melopsittaci]RIY33874.1 oxygen-independent coproporphyrinogen III oxidase [Psittacicella melopsittaci]